MFTKLLKQGFLPKSSSKHWIYLIPEHGMQHLTVNLPLVFSSMSVINESDIKLKPEFLSKCDILQKKLAFHLSRESLRVQFEDFLTEHYFSTNMNEPEFLSFVINLSFHGYYDDFIRLVTF
jgi:hypothetical protein